MSDVREVMMHEADGHTLHCAKRIVWGDGECQCGRLKEAVEHLLAAERDPRDARIAELEATVARVEHAIEGATTLKVYINVIRRALGGEDVPSEPDIAALQVERLEATETRLRARITALVDHVENSDLDAYGNMVVDGEEWYRALQEPTQ